MVYCGTVQPQMGTSLCSVHLDTKALWSEQFIESSEQFLETALRTQYRPQCMRHIEVIPNSSYPSSSCFPFHSSLSLLSCSFQTLHSKTNLKSSGLAQRKRNLTPYNPLTRFSSFFIRRRCKHLTYGIIAVLLLVLAALVTVTVEFEKEEPHCCSSSNFWSILDSFYWKNKVQCVKSVGYI